MDARASQAASSGCFSLVMTGLSEVWAPGARLLIASDCSRDPGQKPRPAAVPHPRYQSRAAGEAIQSARNAA